MEPGKRRPQTADEVPLSQLTPSTSLQPQQPAAGDRLSRHEQFPSLTASSSRQSIFNALPHDGSGDLYRGSLRSSSSSRLPSIRLRRNSNASIITTTSTIHDSEDVPPSNSRPGRPRSTSQPGGALHSDRRSAQTALPRLTEEGNRPTMAEIDAAASGARLSPTPSIPENASRERAHSSLDIASTGSPPRRRRALSRMFWPAGASDGDRASGDDFRRDLREEEYEEQLVDLLDVVDPEVQTLSTLTNIQNSLFIPDLGGLINRRPTYSLTQLDRPPTRQSVSVPPPVAPEPEPVEEEDEDDDEEGSEEPTLRRSNTISSRISDSHYAALPHGTTLDGWTQEEKDQLDDHVRHMLHSRRSKFKRMMKGFGQYVRRPLGFFVTLYAVLITLFGLAWVLFLIGWIYVGSKERQDYTIFVIDSVLVALFAIMGDGLIPWRTVDTYRMIHIVHYSRIMKKAREEAGMDTENIGAISSNTDQDDPELERAVSPAEIDARAERAKSKTKDDDVEELIDYPELFPLTPKQQKKFLHHRDKFANSHSFYKPEETFTHYPFPLSYLMAIVILLDCHSCLQVSLGVCTWAINYHHRHPAITTTILCVSITCNITAGLVITAGDRKTRKKDVIKLLDRQALTQHAIKKVKKRKQKAEMSHTTTE